MRHPDHDDEHDPGIVQEHAFKPLLPVEMLAKSTEGAGSIPAPSASRRSWCSETRSTNQHAALATKTDQRLRAGTRKGSVENRESERTCGINNKPED